MSLCLICLRTDRLLKLANNSLQEFHDELCDISIIEMTSASYFCNECEHILMKFHKFKDKCVKALKIYRKWTNESSKKKRPVNLLYTLLPPSPLRMWSANSNRIANFTIQAADTHTDPFTEVELMKDKYTKQVKVECDQNDSSDNINIFADVIKNEEISKNLTKSEYKYDGDDLKNDSETEENKFFENLDKLLEGEANDGISDLNVKRESEVSNLVTNFLNSKKRPSKKTTAKKKQEIKVTSKRTKKKITAKENIVIEEKLPKIKKPSKKMRALFEKMKENNKMYETVFDIEYLRTQEMKLEEFQRRKTYDCYVRAEHRCEVCFQIFKSLNYLKYHTEKYHTESPGSVRCSICSTWHSKRGSHNSTHSVVFKCRLCPLVTYHRESMQKHYEWHNGKVYRCEECNLSYKSASVYRAHMGRVHRRGVHVCEACGRGFRSPLGLTIHKNSSSRCTGLHAAGGVSCHECDVTLPSQEVYDAHIFDVHEAPRRQGRPLTTNSAGLPPPATSRSTVNYARGYRVRKFRPAKHTCRVCNLSGVISWFKLQQHFKAEHPNEDMAMLYADKAKHLCDICGTGFSNMYALRDHMNIHTGARPYGCDLCPKQFRSAILLREHRVRHFPSTVSCTFCGKLFKSKGNLCSHMKTHTGEKSHKCEICGKGFLHKVNLKEHIRGVHYNIRRVKRGGTREGVDETGAEAVKRTKVMAGEVVDDFGSDSK